jgi:hypothetical protein
MLGSTESISFFSDQTAALAAVFVLEVAENWSEVDPQAGWKGMTDMTDTYPCDRLNSDIS